MLSGKQGQLAGPVSYFPFGRGLSLRCIIVGGAATEHGVAVALSFEEIREEFQHITLTHDRNTARRVCVGRERGVCILLLFTFVVFDRKRSLWRWLKAQKGIKGRLKWEVSSPPNLFAIRAVRAKMACAPICKSCEYRGGGGGVMDEPEPACVANWRPAEQTKRDGQTDHAKSLTTFSVLYSFAGKISGDRNRGRRSRSQNVKVA